jgi:hypothetical protein
MGFISSRQGGRAQACEGAGTYGSPEGDGSVMRLWERFIGLAFQFHFSRGANEKSREACARGFFEFLGWLMGLEPTTTGITILDSTN